MANLGTYYGLCPLIDHRSLLGIAKDHEDGVIIVTLGKNIAIKYRLSDQKAIHSWRTKERFTSPIIYDEIQSQYVAVFNQSYIRMWTGDEEQIDKLKKYRFNNEIYTILSCNNSTYVVFVNGSIHLLNDVILDHKNFNYSNSVIKVDIEVISEILYTSVDEDVYVGLLVTCINNSSNHKTLYWTKFNSSERNQKFYKIILERENYDLTGYLFHVENNKSVSILSLWSDDRLYSYPLEPSDIELKSVGELFSVIESVSCKEPVSMCSLDSNYIVMYGSNCNEEGALVTIYNVQFKITQSKQLFKMFTKGAKLWCIEQNLFLAVGQHLAVVPFYLHTEQLAALVGSRKEAELDADVYIVDNIIANWTKTKTKQTTEKIPKELKLKIVEYLKRGLAEMVIIDKILPDIIESKDLVLISQCINYFTDISEKYLVKLLKLLLNFDADLFETGGMHPSIRLPPKLQPIQRIELINEILAKPFSNIFLLPYIEAELDIDEVLLLLKYICFLLTEDELVLSSLDNIQTEEKLIEWGSMLLDGNYQKILLTKNEDIIQILNTFNEIVDEELDCIDNLRESFSLLDCVVKRKTELKSEHLLSNYSIEECEFL